MSSTSSAVGLISHLTSIYWSEGYAKVTNMGVATIFEILLSLAAQCLLQVVKFWKRKASQGWLSLMKF